MHLPMWWVQKSQLRRHIACKLELAIDKISLLLSVFADSAWGHCNKRLTVKDCKMYMQRLQPFPPFYPYICTSWLYCKIKHIIRVITADFVEFIFRGHISVVSKNNEL